MFLPSAGSAAAAQAAQAAAVASVTQQQLQLQTAAQHINNVGVANVTGQTQVPRRQRLFLNQAAFEINCLGIF